jgi:hypothetical protein
MERSRVWAALSPGKWPGYAVAILGAAWHYLDVGGRLDLAWHVVEGMGGTPALIAQVLLWQWTGLVLVAAGLGYVVFVGEPKQAVRHHWWRYVGWSIFSLVLVAMIAMGGYGWLELALRRAHDEGVAGIARGTPSDNTPSHPQRPLESPSRVLQPDQIRILLEELPKFKQQYNNLPFFLASTPNDNETWGVARQYSNLLIRSGLNPRDVQVAPRGPQDQGLLIITLGDKPTPQSAVKLREILALADIPAQIIRSNNRVDFPYLNTNDVEFIFYVAPAPIN